nr:unnamed protein product [Spirometra erinaceieuropaei]
MHVWLMRVDNVEDSHSGYVAPLASACTYVLRQSAMARTSGRLRFVSLQFTVCTTHLVDSLPAPCEVCHFPRVGSEPIIETPPLADWYIDRRTVQSTRVNNRPRHFAAATFGDTWLVALADAVSAATDVPSSG